MNQFLDHVGRTLGPRSELDPERAARAVFDAMWEKVDPGEVAKLINLFPEELRDLWPRVARARIEGPLRMEEA